MTKKSASKWQYGDFQTPQELAQAVVRVVRTGIGLTPKTILEPSCGEGAFLLAAAEEFTAAERIIGYDINPDYVATARRRVGDAGFEPRVQAIQGDFFSMDWKICLEPIPKPLLVLGNPPWVTSAELGMLGSSNLPDKTNFQGRRGIDAITGKSNFDLSEWMLLKYIEWLRDVDGAIAVLCKTSVARKVMAQTWAQGTNRFSARIYPIDAKLHFDASVQACLFILEQSQPRQDCTVYHRLSDPQVQTVIGYRDRHLVRDAESYDRWMNLRGQDPRYLWRSGVKHDCARIMELEEIDGLLVNGLGQRVSLEPSYLFPLLKSSDVGNGRTATCRKHILVTQSYVGESTDAIKDNAPKTWTYLESHQSALNARTSSIYRGKSRYSIFGVGPYTFSDWKIAISGLYKKLQFSLVGPVNGKPTIVDDTVYFLSIQSREEAEYVLSLLNSSAAREFLSSMIFWDEKRPITAEILRRLSLKAVAEVTGSIQEYLGWASSGRSQAQSDGQLELGIAERVEGCYERAST